MADRARGPLPRRRRRGPHRPRARRTASGPVVARPDVRRQPATPRPGCSRPPPTRAACRGTPSAADRLLAGLGRDHHGVEGERLGAVALDLEGAGEHAADRVQLAGGQAQEVGAVEGDGGVASLTLGRVGLDRAAPVAHVHDVAVDLPVAAPADPEADRQAAGRPPCRCR